MNAILHVFSALKFGRNNTSFNIPLLVLLLIAVFPLSGCSQNQTRKIDEELEKNIRLWQESKISSYNFVIYRLSMGSTDWLPALIKVRKGQVVSKEPIGEPGPMTVVDGHEKFETVEKMFATIQEAYDKGYGVNNKYNSKYGYPEEIRIDTNPRLTDQTIITRIKEFGIIDE